MSSAFAVAILALGTGQAKVPASIGPEAWATVDRFFDANGGPPKAPLIRRAFATYVEASRAYRAKDYKHCLETLDELWRDRPIGNEVWWRADDRTAIFQLGLPTCYPTMLMLDEAVRWRLDPESTRVKPYPIVMNVVLFGHSQGLQPTNDAQLLAGQGRWMSHDLDPILQKNDYERIRSVTWLFQEYILAITKGRANLELDFTPMPDVVVPIDHSGKKVGDHLVGLAVQNVPKVTEILANLSKRLKRQPDWWWTIYPSAVPDQYPDFKKTEFITGGNTVGPDGRSLRLEIDDKWMIRRPGFLGQGTYDPLEVEAYMPYWLSHELYHHIFGRFPEFGLEKTGHDWHDRQKWPKDFQGTFEPDYYREALHRRILPAEPPLNQRLRYAPPTQADLAKVRLQDVLGTYRLEPVRGDWHTGDIVATGDGSTLAWKNRAGITWRLFPDLASGTLATGDDNPFLPKAGETARLFTLQLRRDDSGRYTNGVAGYWFQGEFFRKL